MVRIVQEFLKPASYHKAGLFDAERLASAAAETNRALQNGLAIPVIGYHTDPNDPKGLPTTNRDACEISKGWLAEVRQRPDGALEHVLEITDPKAAEAIQNGSIRFTSPQITREFTDGLGRSYGEMFTHVALTPRPRNPDQGPMVVTDGLSTQFSLEDVMDNPEEVEDPSEIEEEQLTEEPEENPDLLKQDGDKKAEAAIAALSMLGVIVPADWKPDGENALDVLLAALNTAAAMKAKADADKTAASADQPPELSNAPVQFSIEEREALPPKVRAALEQAERDRAKAVQFDLQKADLNRKSALTDLKGLRLPKGLKDKFAARLKSVQFSADGEPATLTVLEAAKLVSDSLPNSLQFDGEPKPIDPPDETSGGELTDEQARERAARQLKETGFIRK